MSARLPPLTRDRVALGILAGGRAQRLGGADKALAIFEGRSLVERTLEAAGSGFAQVLLSYNGDAASALPPGARVVADLRGSYPGPLGGIEAMLAAADADWLLTLPVDLQFIPAQLFEHIVAACDGVLGVSTRDADGEQPLVCLWPVGASRIAVTSALNAGERAVHRAQAALGFRCCELAPLRLGNLNSPADFGAGS